MKQLLPHDPLFPISKNSSPREQAEIVNDDDKVLKEYTLKQGNIQI